MNEYEDERLEGAESRKGDPFGYGKRKNTGTYQKGVNSVTGIPDGSDSEALERYIESALWRHKEIPSTTKRKKRKSVHKKSAKKFTTAAIPKGRNALQSPTKTIQDYNKEIQRKMDIIHEREKREAEIRLYGVLWYLVECEIISQGKAMELAHKPLYKIIYIKSRKKLN